MGPTMTPMQARGSVLTQSTRSAPGRQGLPREWQAARMREQPGGPGPQAYSWDTVTATGDLSKLVGEARSW